MKILAVLFIATGIVFAQQGTTSSDEKPDQTDLRRMQELLTAYTRAMAAERAREAKAREAEQLASQSPLDPLERWWKNPDNRRVFNVTSEQQTKFNEVFQQYRSKLVDLNAALEKEEGALEPLVVANPFNEVKTAAQIDRIAQARAELEKARGRMLVSMRKVLTADQWQKFTSRPR